MLKKSLTIPGFLAALFFTWGMSDLLIKLYEVELPFFVLAGINVVTLLALSAVFYNKATLAVFLSALAACALGLLAFAARNRAYIDKVIEKASVALHDLAGFFLFFHEPGYVESRRLFIAALFCLFFAIPSLFLLGRLRGAFLLGMWALALFSLEWSAGVTGYFPALCAIACAILAVSAGSFARRRVSAGEARLRAGAPMPARSHEPGIREGGRLAFLILPCSLAAAVLAFLILPPDAYSMHHIAVETFVDDIVDVTGAYTGLSRERSVFNLREFGYNTQLGGPVSLRGDPVYALSPSAPALYRTAVKDVYTGYSWIKSDDVEEYRFDAPLASDIQQKTFAEGLPVESSPDGTESGDPENGGLRRGQGFFSGETHVTVSLISPGLRSELLQTGRPYSVVSVNILDFIAYFDTQGEMFSKRALTQGHSYTVHEKRVDFISRRFAAAVAECEARVRKEKEAGRIPDPYYSEILARYTGLPDAVEDSRIMDFVLGVTEGIDSPYGKMLALRDSVAARSTYTLEPPYVPRGRELVSWFLDTREGYCNYYATAMAVFARILGLPARYAEGFSTFGLTPEEDGSLIITGKQAHTWCEVYLEGMGWVPVDASVEYDRADDTAWALDDEPPEFSASADSLSEPIWEGDEGYGYSSASPGETAQGGAGGAGLTPGAVFAFAAMLVFLPGYALASALKRVRRSYSLPWLQKRYGGEEILLRYWRDMLRILPYFGVTPKIGETPAQLAGRVGGLAGQGGSILVSGLIGFPEVAGLVERCVYASVAPGYPALLRANAVHHAMDAALKGLLPPHRYMLNRLRWEHGAKRRTTQYNFRQYLRPRV